MSDTYRMVAEVITCECGEPIGIAEEPARSYHDGRELGPLFLAFDHDDPEPAYGGSPFKRHLWPVGSGDAGVQDQRCPNCGVCLVKPAEVAGQLALGV